MGSLPLFIVDLQSAKRRLRKMFEMPAYCGSRPGYDGVVQRCRERAVSLPKPVRRYQIRTGGCKDEWRDEGRLDEG